MSEKGGILPTEDETHCVIRAQRDTKVQFPHPGIPIQTEQNRAMSFDVGASLVFDDGNTVEVVSTTTEPNLIGVPIGRMTWDNGAAKVGLYLRRTGIGQTLWYGQFDVTADWQLISTQPGLMLRAEMAIGGVVKSFFPYEWYQRFGAPSPNFFGNSDLTTQVEGAGPVTTPLGTFTDAIEVSVENDYGSGVAGFTFRFWLARGVGLVRYQIGSAPVAGLVRGTVGGQLIVPR